MRAFSESSHYDNTYDTHLHAKIEVEWDRNGACVRECGKQFDTDEATANRLKS